jgi:hypothetical protein
MRVELPVYADRMGDRCGEVVRIEHKTNQNLGLRHAGYRPGPIPIAHVKLDISGKTVKVLLDDCKEI